MPLVLILLLIGVVSVLWSIAGTYLKDIKYNFWFAGVGTVLVVFSLFLIAGFNNTSFYPSSFDLQSSLTIQNASSSHYTLTVMSYVSLLVPFVFAYIYYAFKIIDCVLNFVAGVFKTIMNPKSNRKRPNVNVAEIYKYLDIAMSTGEFGFSYKYPITKNELKNRFRSKIKQVHPDCGGKPEDFIRVKNAYDLLINYSIVI